MKFNVGDEVTHIFYPKYGVGRITNLLQRGCVVQWSSSGTSLEQYSNLTKVEE